MSSVKIGEYGEASPVSEGNESAYTAEEVSRVDRSVFSNDEDSNARPVIPVIAVEERTVSSDELPSERGGEVAIDTRTEGGVGDESIEKFVGLMDHNRLQTIGSDTPELDSKQPIKSSPPVSDHVT
jgi:hypothetical protein